jgi:hypothetical protein
LYQTIHVEIELLCRVVRRLNCCHLSVFHPLSITDESLIPHCRYDSVGKTSQLQLQFKLAGPIHSLGALSSRFLISGSQSGKIDVVSLWKETSPNEGNETFEATSVPARPGFLPPLPNARSSFSSIGPASIIRGLARYHPTNQSLCMFAAGWVDGRICIFNILRIPEGTATPSASKSPLPPNSCWEWSVVQSFHTRYSLFRLDYVRLKSPYQLASLLPRNSTVDDLSSQDQQQGQGQGQGQDLDSNWQSVHGDLEDEEVNYQQAREEGYLIASSHTGHTVIINLLSSDFGESSATSGEDQRSRRLFSFDSRHALHGEVVRYTAIGRLSHVRPQPTQPAAVSASSPQPSSLSLVYLTGRGDIWIVSDIEVELSLLGPPTIPSLCFSSAEIEKANRVVRMWNIIKPIPSPQPLHPTHRSTSSDTERSISSCNPASVSVSVSQPHHHDGVDLIRRLLSTSLADLQQMADLTSLEAWSATASPMQGQESGESEKGKVKGMPQDQQEECALSPADLSCSSAAPSPPL